jgi:hypothetical protein
MLDRVDNGDSIDVGKPGSWWQPYRRQILFRQDDGEWVLFRSEISQYFCRGEVKERNANVLGELHAGASESGIQAFNVSASKGKDRPSHLLGSLADNLQHCWTTVVAIALEAEQVTE